MIPLYCFYCDNIDERMVSLHQEAAGLIGIDVCYSRMSIDSLKKAGIRPHEAHGLFIENLLLQFPNKLIGIIDIDCILASQDFLVQCEKEVANNGTMLGLAQSANHLPSKNDIYPAPAFTIINSKAWHDIGKPSLVADGQFDTAQRFSNELKKRGKIFSILMPQSYTHLGTIWNLGGKPGFGIGTIYDDGNVFHLFQSAHGPSYLSLYEEKVNQLRKGATIFAP